MPLAAGTRLGAYEIVSRIGAGGMGEVYRARDTRLDRAVAIKILGASTAEWSGRRALAPGCRRSTVIVNWTSRLP
jgi:hypothetical protein